MAPAIQESNGSREVEETTVNRTLSPYTPLEDSQIRLVEILPVNEGYHLMDDVICRLKTVTREQAPPYNALSYCWGPPEQRNQGKIFLRVENPETPATEHLIKLLVTSTLEAALKRLRCTDGQTSQMIWTDAICINQEDAPEKGKQVQSMRNIYQNATEVSIWLGDEDENSLTAWKLIEDIEKCENKKYQIEELIDRSREKQFDALLALFRRDYFWRIWVVQEVTCAKQAIVYCGSKRMPWPSFLNIGTIMKSFRDKLRDSIYHDRPAALFSLMTGGPGKLEVASRKPNEVFQQSTAPPLISLLRQHMSKSSTTPHDKVYGLMGIASDGPDFGPVDYERSPRATFIDIAQRLISKTQKLNTICLKQNDDNFYLLPSWATDWERRNLYPTHRVVGLQIRQPPFKAAGDSLADAKFLEDGEVLLTSGYVVDTITTVAQPLYVYGPESEVTPTLIAFHNWFSTFVNHIGTNDLDVFARVFVGGAWYPHYSEFEKDLSQRLTFFFGLIQKLLPGLLKNGNPVRDLVKDYGITREVLEARESAMVSAAALRMHAKRFVISRTKLAGLAPQEAVEGDKIVVLLGCDFPVVLRQVGDFWKLIGEVYVDGIMDGESVSAFRTGVYVERSFAIR